MKRRKLNVSKLLTLGLLLSYSANIAANTTSETTSIQQNSSYKVTGVVSGKHSKKCTFYTLRFGCSFAAVNTIKPQLL